MKAVGSDLNPVAVIITKALIEIPPKFANKPPINPNADPMGMTVGKGRKAQKVPWRGAAGLADDIRYYGRWMRDEAFKRIGHLYPTIKDENGIDRTVIAWLWTRTVPCANPACGVKMPLIKSFQLSKKKNNEHWTKPIIDRDSRTVSFHVQDHSEGVPAKTTIDRNGTTCIACRNTVKLDYVRQQARDGKMIEQMTAVVADSGKSRAYFSPNSTHQQATSNAKPSWRPTTMLPAHALGFTVQNYGFTRWDKLFSERQLAALSTFSDLTREVNRHILDRNKDAEYADAVCIYLALAIGRFAESSCKSTRWRNDNASVVECFGRQVVTMVWDYAEANPFSVSMKNWIGCVETVAKVLDMFTSTVNDATAFQTNATSKSWVSGGPVIITDPPYYDNINYSDISDFFYVWHRQTLRDIYPELYSGMLTPKLEEMIVERHRFTNARARFENLMGETLSLIRENCTDAYPSSIFYGYKQQEEERDGQMSTGWETMLNAVVSSGFQITGTWPINTELSARQRAMSSNALTSSIILVCRPRPEDAPSITRQQFLDELADNMPAALDQLTHEGHIAPTDLAQSAIGPGMEIYSKYSSVTYISGKRFTVRDALMAINLEIQKYDERETGDLDAESQFCVTWLKQHGFDEGEYGVAETLSKAKNIDVDDLADMHDVLTAESGKVQLHDIDYYHPPEHDPELPIDDRGGNMTAWEACFRIAYHMDYGRVDADEVRGAALVFNTKGRDTERIERLARILYNYHDSRGEAREAYPFNAIATRWNEIFVEANRLDTSHQETLT